MCYQVGMVCLYRHHGNLGGQWATMEVIGGGEETPLSVVRLCKIGVLPRGAVNMNESPHLFISYL